MTKVSDAEQLQADINAAMEWSQKWQLCFNTGKCKVLHIGGANNSHAYSMGGSQLESTTTEHDLGVQIDDELKFREHAAMAVSKASQILAVIRRSFEHTDTETLPTLYKALV